MDDEMRIIATEQGPYVVRGGVPLTAKTPVKSERGEPLAWRTTSRAETGDRYELCRCGQSSHKPFCDDTHARTDWDGADGVPGNTYVDRAESLGGTGIEIRDDRMLCARAGFCGNRITDVWAMAARTDDVTVRTQAMAMIDHCPSGALTYLLEGGPNEPDLPTGIAAVGDGPLWVTGGVTVECVDGSTLEPRNRVTLCRCGQSSVKPLCDGSHAEVGFKG